MYLGQGKCVSSFLFDGMIKFIGPLKTSGVPGFKVDAMEVMLPIGPLFTSGPHGSLFPLGHDSSLQPWPCQVGGSSRRKFC